MASIVTKFDPSKEVHVLWLQKVDTAMIGVTDQKKVDLAAIVNDNPIVASKVDMVEWAFTHFQIAMKYSQAVLRGTAFIPKTCL
jgi:hypothetical protein|tara:strand:+ start:292 stop:543 length:252 start_codon:yes stop_codon:yes gene_type:complete